MKLSLPQSHSHSHSHSHREDAADFLGSRNAGRNLRCIESAHCFSPKFSVCMAAARYRHFTVFWIVHRRYNLSKLSSDLTITQVVICTIWDAMSICTSLLYTLTVRQSDNADFLNHTTHPAPFIAFRGHLSIIITRRPYWILRAIFVFTLLANRFTK